MSNFRTFYPDNADIGIRLDVFLANELENISRSLIQKMIIYEQVLVNGDSERAGRKIRSGDIITVDIPEPTLPDIIAEDIPLDIIYEDEHLVVINKQRGMVVHPAPGHYTGTLVNALMHHCCNLSGINGVLRPGIVHRIDRDTSGAIVVAKTDLAHVSLSQQLAAHEVQRKYHGLARNIIKNDTGIIQEPIGRHMIDRKRMTVTRRGKPAVTHYRVLGRYGQGSDAYTYIEATLETGRTHQIRVHMHHIGHSLLGDRVYGKGSADKLFPDGQALHAKIIGFKHPYTGEYMEFETGLPEYISRYI